MPFTCEVAGCGRDAKAGGLCIGHAMERKRQDGDEPEKPAPKKRGPKPKPKTEKGAPPILPRSESGGGADHTLTLTLSKELQEKLLQYAVAKLLDEAEAVD